MARLPLRGVLFDFDQTLFDTSHLQKDRRAKKWDSVRAKLHTIHPYEGIIGCLKRLRNVGYRLGVVTNSPRWIPEEVFKQHDIEMDAIVGYGDTRYHKPDPAPLREGAKRIQVSPDQCAAVGDRCIDTAAARTAQMVSIGAEWHIPKNHEPDFRRDLLTSRPQYLIEDPNELSEVLVELFQRTDITVAGEVLERTKQRIKAELWSEEKYPNRRRHHLVSGDIYLYGRWRYKGGFQSSYANQLIANLKMENRLRSYPRRWGYKVLAATQFAEELDWVLPTDSIVLIIPGSKLANHPEYDPRPEMIASCLKSRRPDLQFINPIDRRQSTSSVHSMSDSSERSPVSVEQLLEWNGSLPTEARSIYIVDDVITSGGHFKAYKNLLLKHAPHLQVIGVFWTAQRHDDVVTRSN